MEFVYKLSWCLLFISPQAAIMTSVTLAVRSLTEMFYKKTQEFISEINTTHMVWLEEIQQEANSMFTRYVWLDVTKVYTMKFWFSIWIFFYSFFTKLCFVYFRDFNTEPELMPKTPSQRKKNCRKRVSVGRREESQGRRYVALVNVLQNSLYNLLTSFVFNL